MNTEAERQDGPPIELVAQLYRDLRGGKREYSNVLALANGDNDHFEGALELEAPC